MHLYLLDGSNWRPVTPADLAAGGGGGGGGDASAANQATQITAANLTNTKLDAVATQTTAAAILAKIIAAPATEAKQDTQITALGTKTTSVTALETGGVGIIGWLSQLWRDLVAMSGKLPATLGVKASAAAVSVVIASDDAQLGAKTTASVVSAGGSGVLGWLSDAVTQLKSLVARLVTPATLASISGTITTGATAQNAAASNAVRLGFMLQNNSTGDLWFSTLATAVAAQPSIKVPPGAFYETPLGGCGTGAISIIGATTGQAFTGREW